MLFASARIGAKKLTKAGFINNGGSQFKNGLCGGFFGGGEPVKIEFEEQHTDHKADAFVATNEGMILHDASRVPGGMLDDVELAYAM